MYTNKHNNTCDVRFTTCSAAALNISAVLPDEQYKAVTYNNCTEYN